ncbi:hypothetical protein FEM48_Zijuj10G0047900 [Ziziphus jujuba var. spinosa]|uniref:mRNA export factor GLE1 n=1 Tax=Ziziphus jujuba var. spinosa TaxID=714518 RepID=A0A978ULD7_ZIZJJ|nr:hypothetical protein FEM48_Zijuj10G0047900 [Ziziphus jujuba var. spinosa]
MGIVNLELPCPRNIGGIGVDPDPDWSFDALVSELNALEAKLSSSSKIPVPFTKEKSRNFSNGKTLGRSSSPFVMRISEDEMDGIESEEEEVQDKNYVAVNRFNFDELDLSESDDSDGELSLEVQPYLMEEVGLVEGALFELTLEHELRVKDEIRNKISALETDLMNENQKYNSALNRIEKYREARRESERKLDTQYQRKIAEALDNHLTAIQRDHERKSQIEERKIRSDAAYEEAKRREKALQEEKLRQEKAKAEAEAKLRAEEAKRAALEAQKRAEKEAAEASNRAGDAVAQETSSETRTISNLGTEDAKSNISGYEKTKKSPSAGNSIVKAAESALKLEQERLKKCKELDEGNQTLRLNPNKDLSRHERNISKLIRQITGTRDVVWGKATELVKILNSPEFPKSISVAVFAKKVVSHGESPGSAAFACAYVIVLVTSQIPLAMDLILAEFHKACIYTVPKHIVYSQSAFESKDAYYKTIGFREDEGKIENIDDYLKRIEAYMKLYGALVQTEVGGVQNLHGLKEGWAWLARFLNTLPANKFTAVALSAFLRTAGFGLFRKYKSQFMKMLNIISDHFLNVLKAREDSTMNKVIAEIQFYIEDKQFLKEPEGRSLEASLLSSIMVPKIEDRQSYGYQQSRDYYY